MGPDPEPPRPPSARRLLSLGAACVVQHRRAAIPLALAFGWAGLLLVGLAWPYLGPDSQLGAGDALFLIVALNLLHYAVATAVGSVWVRLLVRGPDSSFAGGWPVFFTRWKRALSRLGSVVLLGVVLALPAVFAAAMLGHMLSLLLGGAQASGLQLPLVILVLVPLALIVAGTLWLSIAKSGRQDMPRFDIALRTMTQYWRPLFSVMLAAFGLAVILQASIIALGNGSAPDPTTILGGAIQLLAGAAEMLLIMGVIAAFVDVPLATPAESS